MLASPPQANHMLANDGMYCNYILDLSIPVSLPGNLQGSPSAYSTSVPVPCAIGRVLMTR